MVVDYVRIQLGHCLGLLSGFGSKRRAEHGLIFGRALTYFDAGHTTDMALINIQDLITKAIDTSTFSIGIFLDLAKAFDTVDHRILLKKLEYYGIRGTPLLWF